MNGMWNGLGDVYAAGYSVLAIMICLLYATAAWLVSRLLKKPASVRQMTRLQYMNWKKRLSASALDKELERAGRPFGMNAWKLQLGRYGVFILWLGDGLAGTLWEGIEAAGWPQLVMSLWGPVTWLLLTNTKASLLTPLIHKGKEMHDGEKNRELFMVYSMIADELRGERGRRLNLHSLLTKLKDYTVQIKPALNKGLRAFDEGPHEALRIMAEHIGTREAAELCKLLADLDATPAEEIALLLDAREESFTHMLRENRRRRRRFFGSIAYAIAFSPLLIYLWNALNVAQQYVTDLARSTNHFG
ncbi:hypothetical protein LJK87_31445 [Paenibacillus sp. P25]|nr:hypothetical protein LJK87_31445 [Paenibacillus sp. P25]